jgi:hypothetical protein
MRNETTKRTPGTLVGLLLASAFALMVGVLALPAIASAGSTHFLKIYKVEKQVDLDGGEYAHEHTYCNAGDYAVDGMWRVDNVDQANPQIGIFGDLRDVTVTRSYSDLQQGSNGAKWHFELTNNADGRAQVKLFATCLGRKTAENSHRHKIKIRPLKTTAWFPGSDFSSPALGCIPGREVAVGPGFKMLSGADAWLKSSYPGNPLSSSWNWNFVVSAPSSMEVSVLCLSTKTYKKSGHAHKLNLNLKPGHWPLGAQTLKKKKVQEKKVACYDQSKAIVGAFGIAPWYHGKIHFLGMDPRVKARAFKFWNTDQWSNLPVYVAAICLDDRTGKRIP